jgi:hypothetical protein
MLTSAPAGDFEVYSLAVAGVALDAKATKVSTRAPKKGENPSHKCSQKLTISFIAYLSSPEAARVEDVISRISNPRISVVRSFDPSMHCL